MILHILLFFVIAAAFHVTSAQESTTTTSNTSSLLIAAGCFWCAEQAFEQYAPGVVEAVSGYAGGSNENPTYRNHAKYGHYEVIEISYDPTKTSYKVMVEYAWHNLDPTDGSGQFCDRGISYRPAVFYTSTDEKRDAETVRTSLIEKQNWTSDDVAGVLLLPRPTFWKAEEYHQDYYIKNPSNYGYYKHGCGRTERLKYVWGVEEYECYHDINTTCFESVVNEEGLEVKAEVNAKGYASAEETRGIMPFYGIVILSIVLGVFTGGVIVGVVRCSRKGRDKREPCEVY